MKKAMVFLFLICIIFFNTSCSNIKMKNIVIEENKILFEIDGVKSVFFGSIGGEPDEGLQPFSIDDIKNSYLILTDSYKHNRKQWNDNNGQLQTEAFSSRKYEILTNGIINKKYHIQFNPGYSGYDKTISVYFVDTLSNNYDKKQQAYSPDSNKDCLFIVNLVSKTVTY